MGKLKQVVLSNDPQKALVEIADFISQMDLKEYRYPDGSCKRDFEGYWQPIAFFNKLRNYAEEARRVANHSST